MASLIQDAEAVRAESRRLRCEMFELKLAVRASAHSLEQRRAALKSLDSVRDRVEAPLPSPWTTLHWSYNYRPLADVLVPVP